MSNNKIYKCGFIADVKTVSLALKFPCLVSVLWKRGQKTAQIKERKQINAGIVTFNQKLQIQCNMKFSVASQKFEEKKTKFTVVILSDKGTKQAGQVYLDVSELLNQKSKKMVYEKNLQKCPDKNAKLSFQLTGYIKQQISQDAISQASKQSIKQDISPMSSLQPNFKKKKKQTLVVENNTAQSIPQKEYKNMKKQKSAIVITKQNIPKVHMNALQQQNRQLKETLKQLKEHKIQNENLKRQYETQQKKSRDYYSKKYEQIRQQYKEAKQKLDVLKELKDSKKNLQQQLYENKDFMAGILNYAVLNKKNQLAQELTNIYSQQEQL